MTKNNSEFESIYSTVIFFGLISIAIYIFLLRPILAPAAQAPAGGARDGHAAAGRRQHHQQRRQQAGQQRQQQQQQSASNNDLSLKASCTRVPPHISTQSAKMAGPGGTNLLIDGLLAFRHTKAAAAAAASTSGHDQSSDNNQASIRKERARILSRLLLLADSSNGIASTNGASTQPPPNKGSNLVVSIPASDVTCPKLRRVLYFVATYYNLLVIVVLESNNAASTTTTDASTTDAVKADMKKRLDLVQKLRGDDDNDNDLLLTKDVLPDHRIICSRTVSGRVAFVRQLQRCELVIDYDADVHQQLTRFGHRVILYNGNDAGGNNNSSSTTSSRLGQSLLP